MHGRCLAYCWTRRGRTLFDASVAAVTRALSSHRQRCCRRCVRRRRRRRLPLLFRRYLLLGPHRPLSGAVVSSPSGSEVAHAFAEAVTPRAPIGSGRCLWIMALWTSSAGDAGCGCAPWSKRALPKVGSSSRLLNHWPLLHRDSARGYDNFQPRSTRSVHCHEGFHERCFCRVCRRRRTRQSRATC